MAFLQDKTPAERKKLIWAAALCAAAIFVLAYNFGFFSSSTRTTSRNQNTRRPNTLRSSPAPGNLLSPATVRETENAQTPPQPVIFIRSSPNPLETGRNIFAFYTQPTRNLVNSGVQTVPTETPTPPPPPLILASVSPPTVYARTGEFTLEVSGDKFTPATRIFFGGSELPTQFRSPQQLAATVPAALIAAPGPREIVVRTPDNVLFSNVSSMNIVQPPTPQYTFVGFQGSRGSDTAVLRATSNNELVSVQRGDLVGGRFRVLGISRRSIEFADRELNLRHTLPFTETRTENRTNVFGRPAPSQPPVAQDEEQY